MPVNSWVNLNSFNLGNKERKERLDTFVESGGSSSSKQKIEKGGKNTTVKNSRSENDSNKMDVCDSTKNKNKKKKDKNKNVNNIDSSDLEENHLNNNIGKKENEVSIFLKI